MEVKYPEKLILQHKETGKIFKFNKSSGTEEVKWDEEKFNDITNDDKNKLKI